MRPFGRSPEYNKMLFYQEEIQQVLYPQCGLMTCLHCGWGSKGGVGASCRGRGKCDYMCSVLFFPATSFRFCHADFRAFTLWMHVSAPFTVTRSYGQGRRAVLPWHCVQHSSRAWMALFAKNKDRSWTLLGRV